MLALAPQPVTLRRGVMLMRASDREAPPTA
jgi:hypothetical protein